MCSIFWHFEGYLRGSKVTLQPTSAVNGKITFTAREVQRVKSFFKDQPEAHMRHDVECECTSIKIWNHFVNFAKWTKIEGLQEIPSRIIQFDQQRV